MTIPKPDHNDPNDVIRYMTEVGGLVEGVWQEVDDEFPMTYRLRTALPTNTLFKGVRGVTFRIVEVNVKADNGRNATVLIEGESVYSFVRNGVTKTFTCTAAGLTYHARLDDKPYFPAALRAYTWDNGKNTDFPETGRIDIARQINPIVQNVLSDKAYWDVLADETWRRQCINDALSELRRSRTALDGFFSNLGKINRP